MPTVSVIIPAYNSDKTILETIDSIQAQTFSDFELIVINDGSTDQTLEILSTLDDPRIKIFSYENGGLPVARNRGIDRATGEFITFIDADDLWTPNKLERQLHALKSNPNAGVAYSWTAFIDENSNFLYAREPLFYQGNIYPILLVRNFISSGSNILIRRKLVGSVGYFDPDLKSVEDWDFYLRLAAICPFAVVPEYQILYRRVSGTMTSNIDTMETAILTVIERAFQNAPVELQYLKLRSLANAYRYLAKQCIFNQFDRTSVNQALQKLRKSISFSPSILLSRETFRLIIKILTVQLFPAQMASRFIEFIGRQVPMVSVSKISTKSQ